jgi:NAD(P)-dependent dehydrogenase (short-subunit alcohol dehydrogenase family)
MPHFLISGIPALVGDVAAVLRENGSTAVEVHDVDGVQRACVEAERSFDGYIQLPATFTVSGDTAIARVHHYFSAGVLARFRAVAAALPQLGPGARITFVTGVLPPGVNTDDDIAARAALIRVLGHAARADGPADLGVSMVEPGATPKEIALTALGRNPEREALSRGVDDSSYADWRVELLGMMSAEM